MSEQSQSLTPDQVAQARAKLRALRQVESQAIATSERDATIISLRGELVTFFMAHAEDMLGSWLAAHCEYGPLVAALTPAIGRAGDMIAMARQAQQQQQKPPANVVQLAGK